ncbi:MAG: radical SAM protein [Candidatus Gastranaerophilales bacterium]|nr:radical SAM protein [Candidatus Gastranaerophilales bacterium]
MKPDYICKNPWNYLNIEGNGNCNFCCSIFLKDKHFFGNILEQDIESLWNGEKAEAFRKDIVEGKYTHCDTDFCKWVYKRFEDTFRIPDTDNITTVPYPTVVQFSYDCTCAQRCIFCRDEHLGLSKEQQAEWDSIIDSRLIPLLQNAKLLILNGSGEIFDSEHTRALLHKIIKKYENLKFELYTNGVNLTPENIQKYELENKIKIVHISVNAATRETYKKVFRADNFDRVMKNLQYIANLKKEGKIQTIHINFIINSYNYRDMKKIVQIAEQLDVIVSFAATIPVEKASFTKNVEDFAVFNPKHYLYNDFVKRLKDPIFNSKYCNLDFNTDLKPVSQWQIIKNCARRMKTRLSEALKQS